MATKKDFYEILGVKKTDSVETIKKAYKKLALQHHPDKAAHDKKKEFEDKFKEINEAYSTLSDEAKRRKYDMGESNPFTQGSHSQGGDFSDILRDLFRNGSFGGQFSDDEEDEEEEAGQDLRYEITISFNEAVFGCEKEILVKKNIFCDLCDGTGAEDKEFEKCPKCAGHGRLKINQKTPWGMMSRTVKCDNCEGDGQIPEEECSKCNGKGILGSAEKVKVKIPAGIDDRQTLRIRQAGNAVKNGLEGDLFLSIRVMPSPIFRRDGFDIYIDLPITFSQAALGADISITTLSPEPVKIKIKKGTESGSVLRLKGKGIPYINHPHTRGDQFIKIIIKTPKKLSKAQAKLFEELAKLDEE
ncbi:molecular chaperone DnaJ [Candidatus Pacearchaeota archaeon]|nr:molecular chaperone DnaJ [Candidatus Pacearchaeota archaeon]